MGDENIFETAANLSKKKEPKPPSTPPEAPLSKEILESIPHYDDANKMIEHMHELHRDLETKLEEACDLGGITPSRLKEIVAFTGPSPETANLENKVFAIMGSQAKIAAAEKEIDKMSKTRKAKTVGGRKHWIPIR